MPSSGSNMRPTYLRTKAGEIIGLVAVPDYHPMKEILIWGSRFFVLKADGKYYEGKAHIVNNTLQGDKV